MNKQIFLTVIFFQFCCIVFGQFKTNSIGVCYLQQETSDEYTLSIVLPIETLIKESSNSSEKFKDIIDTITYAGQIVLFDNKGELYSIDNKDKFLVEFWCENDGGIQYRPTLRTTIKKDRLKRKISGIEEIQNICCFVLLNRSKNRIKQPQIKSLESIKLFGDLKNNGRFDCVIWTYQDESGNCDGKPDNNLVVMLQVGKESYRLRCCGP